MDTSGFSSVGKYGTISLLKRQDPNVAVTAFGIDTEELTFGRDPNCSVRLYYPDVSLIHCKVIFEERKAFLVVLGPGGLTVDGCQVNPTSTTASPPITVPLSNNSEFEIRGKRFRFTYPPKELRAALLATPSRPDRRAPRLSMIQSAQVFTPKPSNDPRENLRILKSPLKNTFKSPVKKEFSTPSRNRIFAPPSSPLKALAHVQEAEEDEDEEDEEDEDIVLVEGNHPRVVEEEADLIILEDVVQQAPTPRARSRSKTPSASSQASSAPAPTPAHVAPVAAPPPPPPQTPRRSRPSLYHAVLIRSAQRAVHRAEREERERREDEDEEMEVLESVASPLLLGGGDSDEEGDDHDGGRGGGDKDEEEEAEEEDMLPPPLEKAGMQTHVAPAHSDEEMDQDEEEEEKKATPIKKLSWRKSMERLWPFRTQNTAEEDTEAEVKDDSDSDDEDGQQEEQQLHQGEQENEEQAQPLSAAAGDHQEDSEEDEDIQPLPLPSAPQAQPLPAQTPIRRPLGSFMTPQVTLKDRPSTTLFSRLGSEDPQSRSRQSMEPQRMTPRRSVFGLGNVPKTEQVWRVRDLLRTSEGGAVPQKTPFAPKMEQAFGEKQPIASPSRSVRRVVDEAERQAIRERRRSALRELDSPFGGLVPGMGHGIRSPMKTASSTSTSSSTTTTSLSSTSTTSASPFKSPTKLFRLANLSVHKEETPSSDRERGVQENDEQEDTRSLLDKMVETVEGMKRRRSMAGTTPARTPSSQGSGSGLGLLPRMSLGFDSLPPLSPSKVSGSTSALHHDAEEEEENKENQASPMDMDEDVGRSPAILQLTSGMRNAPRFSLLRSNILSELPPQDDEDDDMDMDVDEPGPAVMDVEPEEDEGHVPMDDAHEQDEEPEVLPPPAKLHPTRRTRKQTAESADEAEPEPALAPTRRSRRTPTVEPEHPAPVAPRRGRSRSATVEPEEAPVAASREPAKRGRKPTVSRIEEVEQEPEEEEEAPAPAPVSAPVKATGRRKAPAVEEDAETEVAPVAKTAAKTGRIPKAASRTTFAPARTARTASKAKASEPEDDDELDMIDEEVQESTKPTRGSGKKKATKEAAPAANPPPTRIAARVKSNTSLKSAATAAKTAATTKPTPAAAPKATTATKTPAIRARATRKTPATAPAATTQGDKENTPGSDGAATEEPVKVRVSKTTTRKATSGTSIPTRAVKKEATEAKAEEATAAKGRVMRSTRARTKA